MDFIRWDRCCASIKLFLPGGKWKKVSGERCAEKIIGEFCFRWNTWKHQRQRQQRRQRRNGHMYEMPKHIPKRMAGIFSIEKRFNLQIVETFQFYSNESMKIYAKRMYITAFFNYFLPLVLLLLKKKERKNAHAHDTQRANHNIHIAHTVWLLTHAAARFWNTTTWNA